MKNVFSYCLMFLIGSAYACISINAQDIAHNWALNDLIFAREVILENHPGVYNNLDSEFCNHLDLFFNNAKTRLINVEDDNLRKQILHEFGKSFNDIHLRIIFPKENHLIDAVVEQVVTKNQFLCDITDTVCYIKLPTFDPDEKETEVVRSIIDTMPIVRHASYILFDVRGNGGGSSMWGKKIIDSLFGVGYTHHKRAKTLEKQYVEWRASASNIAYMSTDVREHINKNFGKESKVSEWMELIISGMQKAYDTHDMLYRDFSHTFHEISDVVETDSLCASTIIVLIDGRCASACLDFIDELKLMGKQAILIGKQTMADSLYMECRSLPLPSGKGTIVMPIKVYRNRPRGHNVPYAPDIEYLGDVNDIQAIKHDIFSLLN
jgi:hypothetical protein